MGPSSNQEGHGLPFTSHTRMLHACTYISSGISCSYFTDTASEAQSREMELGGGWSRGLNPGPPACRARESGPSTHLSVNGAVVREGFSAANVGAGDLGREGRGDDWGLDHLRDQGRGPAAPREHALYASAAPAGKGACPKSWPCPLSRVGRCPGLLASCREAQVGSQQDTGPAEARLCGAQPLSPTSLWASN